MLGGDEDDTVGTLGAVDGRCGSILEDFHADDIRGVEGRERGDGRNPSVSEAA